jgi:uncharacterized membrane protein
MEEQDKSQWVQQVSEPLYEAKGWITFLAVISFIIAALALIGAVSITSIMATLYGSYRYGYMPGMSAFSWILPLIGLSTALVYAWIGALFLQTSESIDKASTQGNFEALLKSQQKLKKIFVIFGVLTLVLIILYALIIVIGIAIALTGMQGYSR